MTAFQPTDPATLALALLLLAATLLVGFAITRMGSRGVGRCLAWGLVFAATLGMERLCAAQAAGFRMLALCFVLLLALKGVVAVESRADGEPLPGFVGWIGFATLWVGMRPAVFARREPHSLTDTGRLAIRGLGWLLLGVLGIALARLLAQSLQEAGEPILARILATLLVLPALAMVLHFGLINWMVAFWRFLGVDCRPIMRTPLAARSLGEFWGRRWNLAFTELMAIALVRPLRPRIGERPAGLVAFLASGILHELAISLPVFAGFGLPMLYFTLHGILVRAEPALQRRWPALARRGWPAHLWTLGWLALPLPVLFHPYFLEGVVWPIIGLT